MPTTRGRSAERVELARVAIALGDGVGAEAAVKGALSAGGNAAALRPLLARAYAMQGEGQRALETIDAGPIIPEMIGEAAWVAGDVHLSRGDLGAARDAYDRAVRELPRNSALWVDVARFRGANADHRGRPRCDRLRDRARQDEQRGTGRQGQSDPHRGRTDRVASLV